MVPLLSLSTRGGAVEAAAGCDTAAEDAASGDAAETVDLGASVATGSCFGLTGFMTSAVQAAIPLHCRLRAWESQRGAAVSVIPK